MRKKIKTGKKELNLSYIKVDIHNHAHLTVNHFKDVHKMLKYDFHDALIRYDIDKMVYINHELKESEDVLIDILDDPNEDVMLKRTIKKYMNYVRTVREAFSAILNTQEIIAHFSIKLSPTQIKILLALDTSPELTLKELAVKTGKSDSFIRREISSMLTSFSIPIIKEFKIKGESTNGGILKNHYQITSYGKHLINYIDDVEYEERWKSINSDRQTVSEVFNEQKTELLKIEESNK